MRRAGVVYQVTFQVQARDKQQAEAIKKAIDDAVAKFRYESEVKPVAQIEEWI